MIPVDRQSAKLREGKAVFSLDRGNIRRNGLFRFNQNGKLHAVFKANDEKCK